MASGHVRDEHKVRGEHSAAAVLTDVLGPLDGARIAGGCDHCDAYQRVEAVLAGVWALHVFHDEGCSVLRRQGRHAR